MYIRIRQHLNIGTGEAQVARGLEYRIRRGIGITYLERSARICSTGGGRYQRVGDVNSQISPLGGTEDRVRTRGHVQGGTGKGIGLF